MVGLVTPSVVALGFPRRGRTLTLSIRRFDGTDALLLLASRPNATRRAGHARAVRGAPSSHQVATAHEQVLRGEDRLNRRNGYRRAVESPELVVASIMEWRAWLRAHHCDSDGVWLVLAKKGTTNPTTLSYDDALEEAICFGWIDGQLGRRDAATFRRRFTPRRARSPWSQRNVAIVEKLTAAGRMQPPGDYEVRKAKGDGRWEAAYAGQAAIEVPEDLAKALNDNPRCTGGL